MSGSDVTIGIGAKLDSTAKGAVGEMRETVAGLVSEFSAPLRSMADGKSIFETGTEWMKERVTELVVGPLAQLAMQLGAIDLLMKGLGYSTEKTAEGLHNFAVAENLAAQFRPLLGSDTAAKSRVKELEETAAGTPFQLTDVAQASKVLELLTNGTMSTGAGLRTVMDAATLTGSSLQDMATQIGRMYDALHNGAPIGVAG